TGIVSLAGGGCSGPSMQPGDLTRVQTFSERPRAGNVYLMRGFIGIWSTGIDRLGEEINAQGIRANVYRCEQWHELTDALVQKYKDQKVFEPLVLVGHSWGADHLLQIAQSLGENHVPVDLIITLDPVTPPDVPANVKRCYNLYQSHGVLDAIPYFRGVPLKAAPDNRNVLTNVNIRTDRTDLLEPNTDHFNIEKNEKIHGEVLRQLMTVCPTRQEWVRAHPTYVPPVREAQTASHQAVKPPAATGQETRGGGGAGGGGGASKLRAAAGP
ncbi:MAG TPA: hypothetical protein VH475_04510, partial [Tepidisphaeraceae bacterium]